MGAALSAQVAPRGVSLRRAGAWGCGRARSHAGPCLGQVFVKQNC